MIIVTNRPTMVDKLFSRTTGTSSTSVVNQAIKARLKVCSHGPEKNTWSLAVTNRFLRFVELQTRCETNEQGKCVARNLVYGRMYAPVARWFGTIPSNLRETTPYVLLRRRHTQQDSWGHPVYLSTKSLDAQLSSFLQARFSDCSHFLLPLVGRRMHGRNFWWGCL